MNPKIKKIIVLLITIFIAIAIYAWFYPLNKGYLNVTANITNYSIASDGQSIKCPQKVCKIKLKSGSHNVRIQKDGYFWEDIRVIIKRGNVSKATTNFKKIPTLKKDSSTPTFKEEVKRTLPPLLKDISPIAPTWNKSGTALTFVDKKDNRLKIWDKKNGAQTITVLKNLGKNFNLNWSLKNKYIFGSDDKDVYFIGVAKAKRKKDVLTFMPKNITLPSKGDYFLANDDKNNLYKIDLLKQKVEPLKSELNLQNSVWDKYGKLIFFTYDKVNNQTVINYYNFSSNKSNVIKYMLEYKFEKIKKDEKGDIYLYNSGDKSWYKLDYQI